MMSDQSRLVEIAHLLDVEPDEVVDTVEGLLAFTDQSNAQITYEGMLKRDASAEGQAMIVALVSDIETARHMLARGATLGDMMTVLTVLADRVKLRGVE